MPQNDHSSEPYPTIRSTLRLPVDAFEVVIRDGGDGVAIVTKNHSGPLPKPGRTTEEHQQAVWRECAWLGAAAGIEGVVSLLEPAPDHEASVTNEVTTRFGGGQTLRSARLTPLEAAQALSGVCEALAALQERNLHHGALSPEHVIIASDGRGVLCSPNTSLNPEEHLDDLTALGQCVTFCLERWAQEAEPPTNLALWLVLAKRLEDRDPVMSARRAATMISDLTALPPARPAVPRRGRLVVALTVLIVLGALITVGLSRNEPVTGPRLRVRDALVRVGSAGHVAIALEPPAECPGAEVYVLDPVTFWIWTFDDIHTSSPGTLLVQIAGATGLAVERENRRCPIVIASGPAGQVQVPTSSQSAD